jgi:hypothetical protein
MPRSRVLRRAAAAMAPPAAGGALLAAVVLAGEPVDGIWQWAVRVLLLVPAVLVHCHRRAERHGFGVFDGLAVAVAAGAVAYAVSAVGLAVGAAAALLVAAAIQTGALAVAVQLAALVTSAITVRAAIRRPA